MNKKDISEGLADLAQRAEQDHEVQMARAELYKLAKYSIKLHDMLKGVSEEQGLEGWVQSKITKASDYISSVYHHLDYDMKFSEGGVVENTKPVSKKLESNDPYKQKLAEKLAERSLTKGETKKKEKYVKGMKKAKGDFKDRYGKDAEAVMYATATKMAKK